MNEWDTHSFIHTHWDSRRVLLLKDYADFQWSFLPTSFVLTRLLFWFIFFKVDVEKVISFVSFYQLYSILNYFLIGIYSELSYKKINYESFLLNAKTKKSVDYNTHTACEYRIRNKLLSVDLRTRIFPSLLIFKTMF